MTLNLQAKDSYHVFDSAGMLCIPSDQSWESRSWWKKLWDKILKREWIPTWSNKSWKDSLGRTVLAWIAYERPKELFDAIEHCYNNPNLYRHPEHRELSSRDHWSYFLIQGYLEYGISRIYTGNLRMRGMNLWMKSLTQIGSRLAEFFYYLIYIPGALIGNAWLKFCRRVGRIGPERDNKWWIKEYCVENRIADTMYYNNVILRKIPTGITNGFYLQYSRTKWQKLWAWIIFQTMPAYALHNKAWQIYVMPQSRKRDKLQNILYQRVGESNLMVRLLFGDASITQQEVDNYPHMTGYRPGVYLDETCRRTIRELTAQEAEFNTYEKDLIKKLYNESCR